MASLETMRPSALVNEIVFALNGKTGLDGAEMAPATPAARRATLIRVAELSASSSSSVRLSELMARVPTSCHQEVCDGAAKLACDAVTTLFKV